MCCLPPEITIECQRDESIRGRELLLMNRSLAEKGYGVLLYCLDNGRIALRVDERDEKFTFVYIDTELY